MKIVCIADTHEKHNQVNYPDGDILIIAGDISKRGNPSKVRLALDFFSSLDYQHIIFVPGNHDFCFEQEQKMCNKLLSKYKNIKYLNDSGITIDNIKFWGSPVSPIFFNWAFNRNPIEIKKHWNLIPKDTDILITHTPPFDILDKNISYQNCGCKNLLNTINSLKLKYHIFGHIHEDYGCKVNNETTFINCSIVNEDYICKNKPIEILI